MKNWTFTLFFAFTVTLAGGQDIQVPKVQNSLVTKMTATWCTICGSAAWDNYKSLVSTLNARALVMAGHVSSSSALYSPTAERLIQNFETSLSHPTFFYNNTRMGSSGTTMVNNITTNVNNANKNTPQAQAGLVATLDPGTRVLTIKSRTEFFQAVQGEYYLGFYLLEKSITAAQAARSSNETHQNVMRTALQTELFGELLASGDVTAGTTKSIQINHNLSPNFNPNNLLIAAIIWKKNGTKYEFVNLNYTGQISASVTSAQNLQLLQGFQILPNLVSDNALIRIDLPASSENISLEVFDVFGRRLQTVFQGRLSEGEHEFRIQRAAIDAPPGYYLLRLRSGQAQAVRQFILQ